MVSSPIPVDQDRRPREYDHSVPESDDSIPIEEMIRELNEQNSNLEMLINRRNALRDRVMERRRQLLRQIDSINTSQHEFERSAWDETAKANEVEMSIAGSDTDIRRY